ncbi:hypothetical protein NHX12_031480 [Muraenolepis orangiensis]|uniref:Cyclic AMP-dependent transcription factor ATF-4 n=1 Tax=Muraenolepis orangiensis TaxID=630683 RepID=A0A9Q0E3T3_9TELE|nr:hypothetical protein NHX12_031480 [Muraenolepis orangiensis]
MDLGEFDLDSLIGSCSADDDAPSSPEDFLASLDRTLELPDLPPSPAPLIAPAPSTLPRVVMSPSSEPVHRRETASPPPCVPEPQEELEIKSEPDSPADTLDLGSEVDVVDSEVKECEVKPVGGAGRCAPGKDKKLKKMEQNKTAATRYRQKKRVEQDSLSSVFSGLERTNIELTEKAESMAREIQYLKELMEEVRTARLRKGLSTDL